MSFSSTCNYRVMTSRAKSAGGKPRVHGNGFIQLDILDEPRMRLHYWGHPDIPRQAVPTPIHDHVFAFDSQLMKGRMVNVTYTTISPIDPALDMSRCFNVHVARKRIGDDTELQPTKQIVYLEPNRTDFLTEGSIYRIEAGEFHETFPAEPSISMMRKDISDYVYAPRVLVPVGKQSDNEFDRHSFSEEELWRIISDIMKEN